jgi:hypothetical protein
MAGNFASTESLQHTACPITWSVSHDGSPPSSISQASMHSRISCLPCRLADVPSPPRCAWVHVLDLTRRVPLAEHHKAMHHVAVHEQAIGLAPARFRSYSSCHSFTLTLSPASLSTMMQFSDCKALTHHHTAIMLPWLALDSADSNDSAPLH